MSQSPYKPCVCPECKGKHNEKKGDRQYGTKTSSEFWHRCSTCDGVHPIRQSAREYIYVEHKGERMSITKRNRMEAISKAEKNKKLIEQRNLHLVKIWNEENLTLDSCAKRMGGLSRERVRQILVAHGVYERYKAAKPKKVPLTPEQKLEIKIQKFWDKTVRLENGCWEVPGQARPASHLMIIGKNSSVRSQLIAWKLHYKTEPKYWIVNTCSNTRCINPEHLGDLTPKETMKYRKNRTSYTITTEKYLSIKKLLKTKTLQEVKDITGYSIHTLCGIRTGRTHKKLLDYEKKVKKVMEIGYSMSAPKIAKLVGLGVATVRSIRCGYSANHITGLPKREKTSKITTK